MNSLEKSGRVEEERRSHFSLYRPPREGLPIIGDYYSFL
jgi:hypothetical protein